MHSTVDVEAAKNAIFAGSCNQPMARTDKLVLTTPTTAAAEIPTMAPAPRLPGCRHVSFGPEITPAISNASCQIELWCSYEAATSGNAG